MMLERGSETTRLYLVELAPDLAIEPSFADLDTRPTLEELSCTGAALPLLEKRLVLDTDDHPEIGPDLEGAILLSRSGLLLVNDNDFGTEGLKTRFWRIDLPEPL